MTFLKSRLFRALSNYYLYGISLFLITRIAFVLMHSGAHQALSGADIFFALLVGFVVDSSLCCVIISLSLLISAPLYYYRKTIYPSFGIIFSMLLSFATLLNIIDCFYYKQFNSRLNYQALEVFYDTDHVILKTIVAHYPVIPLLLSFLVIIVLSLMFAKRINAGKAGDEKIKVKNLSSVLLLLLVFSFIYLGPPFWALCTTPSSMLNTASLNGPYTLIKSIDQNGIYRESIPDYHFCENEEAIAGLKRAIFKTDETPVEGNLPTLRNKATAGPLLKKNIVIVIMESFSASNIGRFNKSGKGFSPYFDEISKEGMLFTSCRSNGPRSQHGIISTVSGFPAIQGVNLQRRKGANAFETLGNILVQEGYNTQFIHNGDAGFDDMSDFFLQGGFENVVDVKDFKTWRVKNEWGISDEDLYDKANTLIWSHNNKPTLSVLMTVSNHFPNEVPNEFLAQHPETKAMNRIQRSYYYSDYAVGKFMAQCKANPEYKNTLFLILADHGEAYGPEDGPYNIFRIPALLLNSRHGAGTFDGLCSQCDFPTTLLAELNYHGNFHFIGQDVFDKDFKPFAFSRPYGNEVLYSFDSLVMKFHFETKTAILYKVENQRDLIELKDKANNYPNELNFVKQYLQSTSTIFKNGTYSSGKGNRS